MVGAIGLERGDLAALKDELGDLLLQVVFHARMAEEAEAENASANADGGDDDVVDADFEDMDGKKS